MYVFDQNKSNTKNDQSDSDTGRVIKETFKSIIESYMIMMFLST